MCVYISSMQTFQFILYRFISFTTLHLFITELGLLMYDFGCLNLGSRVIPAFPPTSAVPASLSKGLHGPRRRSWDVPLFFQCSGTACTGWESSNSWSFGKPPGMPPTPSTRLQGVWRIIQDLNTSLLSFLCLLWYLFFFFPKNCYWLSIFSWHWLVIFLAHSF